MTPADLERPLAEHASSLRTLAQALVTDRHAAEDVHQETALAALQRPPELPRSWIGWLRTVLRHAALKERRTKLRRNQRESRLVDRNAHGAPAAADVAARRELLRGVTDALLEMDEPYQTTLMLRYFEDRTPTEIAGLTGTSLLTVKSRLARGLALLRGKLQTRVGRDWRAGLVAGFGLSGTTAASTAAGVTSVALSSGAGAASVGSLVLLKGAALVSTPKLAATAGGLLACGVLVFAFSDPSVDPLDRPPAAEPAAVSPAAILAAEPEVATREEVVLKPEAVVEPWSPGFEHPYEYEVICNVTDHLGFPVVGLAVHAAPPDCRFNQLEAETDDAGQAIHRFFGKRRSMELLLAVKGHAAGFSFRRLEIQSGRPNVAAFSLASEAVGGEVMQFSVEMAGDPSCPRNQPAALACVTCHKPEVRDFFKGALASQESLHPFAKFVDGWGAPKDEHWHRQLVLGGMEARYVVQLGAFESILSEVNQQALLHQLANQPTEDRSLRGVVRSPVGEPVPRAVVVGVAKDGKILEATSTDEKGAFVFDEAWENPVTLHGIGEGVGRGVVELPGDSRRTDLTLDPGAIIEGRVLDTDGNPMPGLMLLYEELDGARALRVSSQEDGGFRFTNVGTGQGRVLVWGQDPGRPLPVAVVPGVYPNGGALLVTLDREAMAQSGLRISADEEILAAPGLAVRVVQEATGYGAEAAPTPDGKALELAGLPMGLYSVRYGSLVHGWQDGGQVFVGGVGIHEVALHRFPEPGRLQFHDASAPSPTETADSTPWTPPQIEAQALTQTVRLRALNSLLGLDVAEDFCVARVRDDVDLLLTPNGAALFRSPAEIAAGEYVCMWSSEDGSRSWRRFSVQSGQRLVVEIR